MAAARAPRPDPILDRALAAKRESKSVEFKEKFDTSLLQDWCEVIKDIVAIANSGGGLILVGVDDRGCSLNSSNASLLSLDPATMADKIFSYTSTSFSDVQVIELSKDTNSIAGIRVGPSEMPLVFTRQGAYESAKGKPTTAFSKGTVILQARCQE